MRKSRLTRPEKFDRQFGKRVANKCINCFARIGQDEGELCDDCFSENKKSSTEKPRTILETAKEMNETKALHPIATESRFGRLMRDIKSISTKYEEGKTSTEIMASQKAMQAEIDRIINAYRNDEIKFDVPPELQSEANRIVRTPSPVPLQRLPSEPSMSGMIGVDGAQKEDSKDATTNAAAVSLLENLLDVLWEYKNWHEYFFPYAVQGEKEAAAEFEQSRDAIDITKVHKAKDGPTDFASLLKPKEEKQDTPEEEPSAQIPGTPPIRKRNNKRKKVIEVDEDTGIDITSTDPDPEDMEDGEVPPTAKAGTPPSDDEEEARLEAVEARWLMQNRKKLKQLGTNYYPLASGSERPAPESPLKRDRKKQRVERTKTNAITGIQTVSTKAGKSWVPMPRESAPSSKKLGKSGVKFGASPFT